MISKKILQYTSIALLSLSLFSCDKDFNSVGADIIGDDHFQFGTPDHEATVLAFNQDLGVVQSNNLPVNPLGIYNNTTFGKTTASFVTQLALPSTIVNFTEIDEAPLVKDVTLYIPYYSTKGETNDEGVSTYELDSIYGTGKLKLSVYENGYLLRDFDPESNFTEAQKYFSDQGIDFENNKRGADSEGNSINQGERLNNSTEAKENDEFFFDPTEIAITTVEEGEEDEEDVTTTVRNVPGIYIKLNKEFFQKKIIDGYNNGQLVNNNVFRNYFRGLYFKIEAAASDPNGSSLAMINFSLGKITVKYDEDRLLAESVDRVEKSIDFPLSGYTVSLLNHERAANYSSALANASAAEGDERLYLNGGAGSMAIIDLFNRGADGESAELEEYRAKNWLINEANLTFRIDKDALGTNPEPVRIFLYDIDNKRPLIDYYIDQTVYNAKPKLGKIIHNGIIVKEDERGAFYKIRITSHISNLLRHSDSTNVRLGLVVTEAIGNPNLYKLKNQTPNGINDAPISSIMNPLGTVLYGSKSSVPLDQRLRLEIYYTKPD